MTDFSLVKDTVRPIARRHGVERMYLFGSRARGDETVGSDYDFLISKGKVNTLWKFAALIGDLEDALNSSVDVVTDTSNDQTFIAEARKDAVLIYEQTG